MVKLILIRWGLFGLLLVVFGYTAWQMHLQDVEIRKKGVACFDIVQLEKPETERKMDSLATVLRDRGATSNAARNLQIDYWFMPACYGGIAVWLLNLRRRSKKWLSVLLLVAAIMQVFPWVFDLVENAHLLRVLEGERLGMNFDLWQCMVGSKFSIAEGGAIFAVIVSLGKLFFRRYVNIA